MGAPLHTSTPVADLPGELSRIPADVPRMWDRLSADLLSRRVTDPFVVLHGGYGKNNLGDDAILHVLRTRVRARFPRASIHVVCHGPDRVMARYGDVTSSRFASVATLRAIIRSHLYIIGGGGIVNVINTYSGNRVFRLLDPKGKFQFIATLLAGAAGAKTVYYAIGAESFPDTVVRWLTHKALDRADFVSVRDPLTMSNLRAIGVGRDIVQVLDPALSLEPAPADSAHVLLESLGLLPRSRRARPLVGIDFRWVGDPAVDNDQTLEEAAKLAKWLDAHGCDVLFLPVSQHPSKWLEDDLDFGRKLRGKLRSPSWFSLLGMYPLPSTFMALLGECDALVLSRLHAVILGTRMGVPILTVSYDDKVAEFVKLSGQTARMVELHGFTLARVERRLTEMLAEMGSSR